MRIRNDHYRSHRYSIAAVVAALALVSACGGSPSASSSSGASGKAGSEEFGLTPAELSSRIEQTEKSIATCMADAGFQYVALDAAAVKTAMTSDKSAPGLSGEEYIKQFGFGITTQFTHPIEDFGAGPGNMATLNALPSADQVAYRRTLWGESTEWTLIRALEQEDFSQTGGCTKTAAAKTFKPDELSGNYVNPADKLITQDPRMVAAVKAWSDCMRTDGYQYDNPDQVEDDLTERLKAAVQGQDPATVTGPTLDALKQLQGEELAIAAKFTACEEGKITPVQDKVESEVFGKPAA